MRLNSATQTRLQELSAIRKEKGSLIVSQQQIIAELVLNAHKKECKPSGL